MGVDPIVRKRVAYFIHLFFAAGVAAKEIIDGVHCTKAAKGLLPFEIDRGFFSLFHCFRETNS